jgi:hypothetical protein
MKIQSQKVYNKEENNQLIKLFKDNNLSVVITNESDREKEWAIMNVYDGDSRRGCFLFQEGKMKSYSELQPNIDQ